MCACTMLDGDATITKTQVVFFASILKGYSRVLFTENFVSAFHDFLIFRLSDMLAISGSTSAMLIFPSNLLCAILVITVHKV